MLDLLAQDLPALRVVGEPLERGVEVPRLLACCDGGAKDLGKGVREVAQTLGERVAFHHARPHAEHDALVAGLIALLADREQRFLERQTGAHERRELACDHRQIDRAQARPQAELEGTPTILDATRLFLRDFRDLQRQQRALAQELPNLARRIALEYAFAFLARAVDRRVLECTHGQSACVA
jgi:hypothetical protein